MFVAIGNTPRDYAWGSTTAIAELLGREPSGRPEAELWLGAHPGSPAQILESSRAAVGGATDLAAWIAADPDTALGGLPRLPFLLKVLAAAGPLSLQAHPDAVRAAAGFAAENAAGIPLDAPERNYRDPHPKPEIIVALSERFVALCGFRPIGEAREVLLGLGLDELVPRLASLPAFVGWLLAGGPEVAALVERVTARAAAHAAVPPASGRRTKTKEIPPDTDHTSAHVVDSGPDSFIVEALETVRTLATAFPGDASILSALLLNRVTLTCGEALNLSAGNIHAYLSGLGIELMTASDNVLRGGLTRKHVDVAELLEVLDFTPQPIPHLAPDVAPGLALYRPSGAGFALAHVTADARLTLSGPAIALCTSGSFRIDGRASSGVVGRGEALYVTPDEGEVALVGAGDLFVATTA